MQLPKNNTAQPFYFDRQATAPFKVPPGYSFVITDVFVNPEITSFAPGQFHLVVITADGGRSITVRSDGRTAHVRNTTFSTGPVEVQLLGYFVRVATGLGVGKPFV